MPAFATAGAFSASRQPSVEGVVTQHIPAKAGSPSRNGVGVPLYCFTSVTRGLASMPTASLRPPWPIPGSSVIPAIERGIIFRTSRLCMKPPGGHSAAHRRNQTRVVGPGLAPARADASVGPTEVDPRKAVGWLKDQIPDRNAPSTAEQNVSISYEVV